MKSIRIKMTIFISILIIIIISLKFVNIYKSKSIFEAAAFDNIKSMKIESASARENESQGFNTDVSDNKTKAEVQYIPPEEFLKHYNLKVDGEPEKFKAKVLENWDVNAGEYPVGLYWTLANEFSMDCGLDLTPLKGQTVEVWRYPLKDGLPGQGEQSRFTYPSDVIMLIDASKVKGAWLTFNTTDIGPSVKLRYLKDITGLDFENWVDNKKIFSNLGKNSDLSALGPIELLRAYFKAIDEGDKTRAYSCMDPAAKLDSLTMNFRRQGLYNSGFSTDNSLIENILEAKPISFRLMDNDSLSEIKRVGNRTKIEVAVSMKIKWRDSEFNSPTGKDERFAVLKKYSDGWRVEGLGTGP